MAVTNRPYGGEADYQRIRSFLIDAFWLEGFGTWWTVGDLDWWRFTEDDPEAFSAGHLWEAESGQVVAFALPNSDEVTLITHPEHRALDETLVDWAEAHRRAKASDGPPVRIEIWSFDGDPLTWLLEHRGYQPAGDAIHYLRQEINPPPEPILPEGYTLRCLEGEGDIERRVAVHRDAFAPSRMTVAKHRAVMAAPTYRQDLDLVVEAPDGDFAAFTIVWHDPVNRIGLFEPLGTHSAHRRRGLGRAVIQEGLRRLAGLGATTAFIGTDAANPASAALYASAGFEPFKTNRAWAKVLQ